MREAVARFVPDGASVCMGTALEALIPFAAGHELIRQRRRDLTLVGPISDMLFDQLVAAGCVRARSRRRGSATCQRGLGHNYRRAVERGVPHPIEVEDHSNLTIAAALQAGAMGAPYIPTRSLLRHGPASTPTRPSSRRAIPFPAIPSVLIPALTPDVAILHVQRADAEGHAHCWGTLGVTRQARAGREARHHRGRGDPAARAHPVRSRPRAGARAQGRRGRPRALRRLSRRRCRATTARGHDFYHRYHEETRTVEGTRAWLDRWVYGVADWTGFLALLGPDAQAAVRITTPRLSEPLDYGA